jgi:hypothetical protein
MLGEELPRRARSFGAELTEAGARQGRTSVQLGLLFAVDGTKLRLILARIKNRKTDDDLLRPISLEVKIACAASPSPACLFGHLPLRQRLPGSDGGLLAPPRGPARTMTVKPPAPGMCPGVSTVFELGPPVDSIYRFARTDMACAVSATTVVPRVPFPGSAGAERQFSGVRTTRTATQQEIQRRRLAAPTGGQWRATSTTTSDTRSASQINRGHHPLPPQPNVHPLHLRRRQLHHRSGRGPRRLPPTYAYRYVETPLPSRQLVYTLGPPSPGHLTASTPPAPIPAPRPNGQPLMPAPTDVFYSLTWSRRRSSRR